MKINKTNQPPVAQAAVPDGWKLMPIDITKEIHKVIKEVAPKWFAASVYASILDAAPQAPQPPAATLTDAELLKLAEKYYRPNVDALEDMVAFGRAVMAATTQPQAVDEAAMLDFLEKHGSVYIFVSDDFKGGNLRETIIAAMAAREVK